MAFNPDEYLAKKTTFNPDVYLKSKVEAPQQQEPMLSRISNGIAEPSAAIVSGIGSSIYGGLKGVGVGATNLAKQALSDQPMNYNEALNKSTNAIHQAQEDYTYQPRSDSGQNVNQKIGVVLSSDWNPLNYGKVANEYLGGSDKLAESGYPAAATGLDIGAQFAGGAALGKVLGMGAKSMNSSKAGNFEKNATLQSQNALKDANLSSANNIGLVFPPSAIKGGVTTKIAEGLLSGKAKTEQLAVVRNQAVTDAVARKALNLEDGAPLSAQAADARISNLYKSAYEPVKSAGNITTDAKYAQELNEIYRKHQDFTGSFPSAAKDEIAKTITPYNVDSFDAGHAIGAIKNLRAEADASYRSGNSTLGAAQKDVSKALENQVERHLENSGANGAEMLKNYRQARKDIAVAYTVKNALVGDEGMNAIKIGQRLQAGKPLEGDLLTIGQSANNPSLKASMRMPRAGDANPLSVVDLIGGAGGYAINPLLATVPAARVGARYAIMSKPVQKSLVNKTYNKISKSELDAEAATRLKRASMADKLAKALSLRDQQD
jgi:hypothetical protein